MESNKEQGAEHVVICQRVDNKQYYIYREDETFENVITGVRGNIQMEVARKKMKGRLVLTSMANKNPNIIQLLKLASTNNFMTIEIENNGE